MSPTRLLLVLAIVVTLFLIIFSLISGFYTNLLWFEAQGYGSVFWTTLFAKWGAFLLGFILSTLIVAVNLLLARRLAWKGPLYIGQRSVLPISGRWLNLGLIGVALFFGLIFGGTLAGFWSLLIRFLNRQPFAVTDPIFNQDVGFYIFTLPIYRLMQEWLTGILIVALVGVVVIYGINIRPVISQRRVIVPQYMQVHGTVLIALLAILFAFSYYLDRFEILFSTSGVVYGAGYTDVNATLVAYNVLMVLTFVLGILLLASLVTRNLWLPLGVLVLWGVAAVSLTSIYPGIIQRYVVVPNEFTREAPYILNDIDMTRKAYGLDRIQEVNVDPRTTITSNTLNNHLTTLRNVRLWDYRPLLDTYSQIQEIRLYYDFTDVDIDRYRFNDQLTQVNLSAREMNPAQLQNRTWVNEHLEFTHGYGLVMSPVNDVTPEGLPHLIIKDLPPNISVPLTLTRPEIYFGEKTSRYVFVNTNVEEFDYPQGDSNVRATYQGKGGVAIDNPLKRLAFAYRFGDSQIMFTQSLNPNSRIMIYRNIREIVQNITPFLAYDADPYLVVADGRLIWVLDGYTTSDRYPYSQPLPNKNFNYIRNAVKVTVDAYDGTTRFYIADDTDPLIKAYNGMYSNLFHPISEMPDSIRAHVRYPEDMFTIQSLVYATYHMRQPDVFYNKEDVWAIPQETRQGTRVAVVPYYVVMKLLGEEQAEFLLIQPYTPAQKSNMIAWLAARMDGPNLGQMVVYKFPKQELIFGPAQIEARIDQDPTISAQLTLWGQGGSQVIRGNLIVIPLDQSIIYIEPLYLRADTGQLPEFKRVIVASGEKVIMADTLQQALVGVLGNNAAGLNLGGATTGAPPPVTAGAEASSVEVRNLVTSARNHYNAAQEALKAGDWTKYGQELSAMNNDLKSLSDKLGIP
ncbi:MAG: UPF0182 family protein [Chloroflexi bacterium]|nr:UPF0182 family protein [Chloroflexota bacterium]